MTAPDPRELPAIASVTDTYELECVSCGRTYESAELNELEILNIACYGYCPDDSCPGRPE